MRNIKTIVVHCSATPEGKDFHASDIDRWHRQRGFSKIGYHYVIDLDGTVEKGRDESEIGAHVSHHNSNTIGVCYIGGLASDGKTPADTRTEAQKKSLIEILTYLVKKYPKSVILGHRDFKGVNKACPSFDANHEYIARELRQR